MFDINQSNPGLLTNITGNAISRAVFVQDTKTIKFTITTDAAADFEIFVVQSFQEYLPDVSSPMSATNQYTPVTYQDEGSDVTYTDTAPYNPTSAAVQRTFNVNTTGARWVFFVVEKYKAGTLLDLSEMASSNDV